MINNPNDKKKVIVTVDDDDTAELDVDKNCSKPIVIGLCARHASEYSRMKGRKVYRVPGTTCDSGCDICFARAARIYAIFECMSGEAA